MTSVSIWEGSPAAGKSTMIERDIRDKNAVKTSMKNFGIANLLANFFFPSVKKTRNQYSPTDKNKVDSVSLLAKEYFDKLGYLIFITEIIYKAMQWGKIFLLCLIKENVVVDQCLGNAWTNYSNFYSSDCFGEKEVLFLMKMDIKFLLFSQRNFFVKFIYVNTEIKKAKNLWKKRGHSIPYPEEYAKKLIRVKRLMTSLLSSRFTIKKISKEMR